MILIGCGPVHAQMQRLHVTGSYNQNFMITPDLPEYGVLGSPYLNEEFMFGSVRLKDGSSLQTLLRYNVYNKSLEVIVEKDTLELIRAFSLEDFTLNNRRFVYRLYTSEEFNETFLAADYFEVLADAGELILLRQHSMDIQTNIAISNYMGGVGDGMDYFVHATDLFYRDVKNGGIRKLDPRRKEFLNIFGDRKNEVESFIQTENLKLNKEEDVLRIFLFYHSLLS
jgi:hypothetical protein